MREETITSMIRLLDDPDSFIFGTVRTGILKVGKQALPALQNALSGDLSEKHRQRIIELTEEINIRNLRKDLKEWSLQEDNDILQGAYLVNKFQYPEIDFETIDNEINLIAERARNQLNVFLSGLQQIRVFNNLLYKQEKFFGNFKNIAAPQNAFLTDILTEKKGNDISMGILYVAIAAKLNMPLRFVDFPRNMLLAFIDQRNESDDINEKDIIFYINPFNNGAIVTKSDINTFLKTHKIKSKKNYYLPTDNNTVIRRLLTALSNSYKAMGYSDKVKNLQRLIKAVKL